MMQHMARVMNARDFNMRCRSKPLMVLLKRVPPFPPCIQGTLRRLHLQYRHRQLAVQRHHLFYTGQDGTHYFVAGLALDVPLSLR